MNADQGAWRWHHAASARHARVQCPRLGRYIAQGRDRKRDCAFFNRFGQLIYREDRGKFAGYPFPEVGIHRGRLHVILYEAVQKRLGRNVVITDCECVGVEQDARGVTVHFKQATTGNPRESVRADIVVACDGINSALRKQFYPNDRVAFSGINTWRGVTRRKPILGGRTYMRVGSILTGKIVIYPIIDKRQPVDQLDGRDQARHHRAE